MLNKFQLECLADRDLSILKDCVLDELECRQRRKRFRKLSLMTPHRIDSLNKANQEITRINSEKFLEPRNILIHNTCHTLAYLPALMLQDWSSLFPIGDTERKYYVYVHLDPRSKTFIAQTECGGNYMGWPFYIGKGTGSRAYDLKRNQAHGKTIKHLIGCGFKDTEIARIIFKDLTENEALSIESKLIYFFGTVYQKERRHGCLVNLDIPKTPEFVGPMIARVNRHEFYRFRGRELNIEKEAIKNASISIR